MTTFFVAYTVPHSISSCLSSQVCVLNGPMYEPNPSPPHLLLAAQTTPPLCANLFLPPQAPPAPPQRGPLLPPWRTHLTGWATGHSLLWQTSPGSKPLGTPKRLNVTGPQVTGAGGLSIGGGGKSLLAITPPPPAKKGSSDGTPQHQPRDLHGSNGGGICVWEHVVPGQFQLHMCSAPPRPSMRTT